MARRFALVEHEEEEESSSGSEEEEEEEEVDSDLEEAHVARASPPPAPRGQHVAPATTATNTQDPHGRGLQPTIKFKMKGGPAGSASGCKASKDLAGERPGMAECKARTWQGRGTGGWPGFPQHDLGEWPPGDFRQGDGHRGGASNILMPSRAELPPDCDPSLHARCAAKQTTGPASLVLPT